MSDALQAILATAAALTNPRFPPTSRYHALPTATLERGDGTTIRYLTRRFVPQPERYASLGTHVVEQGERLDSISAAELGDPELFWQLCDANRALHPSELEVVGRTLRVVLPEGVPGTVEG